MGKKGTSAVSSPRCKTNTSCLNKRRSACGKKIPSVALLRVRASLHWTPYISLVANWEYLFLMETRDKGEEKRRKHIKDSDQSSHSRCV